MNVVNGGRVLYKAVTKDKFRMKTNFPAQIIKLYHHRYLVFIYLEKMSSGGNKKSAKNTPNKNSKENSSVVTMEKIEEMLEEKFKPYEKNIKSYLAANNELLSKRVNELDGNLNDLHASIEHSDKVNLEKFKAIDGDLCHINRTFRNHAKNKDDNVCKIEEKLRYFEEVY